MTKQAIDLAIRMAKNDLKVLLRVKGQEMTAKKIREAYRRIVRRIHRAQFDLRELRKQCKHLNKTITAKASVGNCNKSDDRHWKEFVCHDCGKYWSDSEDFYDH